MQENTRYKEKAEAMKKASSDFLFSRQEFETGIQNNTKARAKAEQKAMSFSNECTALFNRARVTKSKTHRRTIMKKLAIVGGKYVEASAYTGLFEGCKQENQNYVNVLDKLIRAAGGAKSEAVLLGEHNA